MEFKDRLIKLRKELNLTQEELAQKIGYTRTAISAWEIGRNEPSNADTIKLAEYFGVSTDYLLGKSDIRNLKSNKESEIPEIRVIERGAKNMSQKDREKMVNMVKAAFEEAFSDDNSNQDK